MRWFWAFPLTFVAGVHGFAIFAPYLVLIAMLAIWRRRPKIQHVPTPAEAIGVPFGVALS